MNVTRLEIPDVLLLTVNRQSDERGWFSETYNRRQMEAAGISIPFVQDNHSHSRAAGTLRGLHYQAPPQAQAKLIRVVCGSILDVVVDVRIGSPTYGRWISTELTANDGRQLFVPVGFLHGFVTQEPDTEVLYKVSDYYSKEYDGAVLWNDPALGIDWGPFAAAPVLSTKDRQAPPWAQFRSPFNY